MTHPTTTGNPTREANRARLAHLEAAVVHHTKRGHSFTAWKLRKQADHLRRAMRDTMTRNGERPSTAVPCAVCGWTGDPEMIRCRWCMDEGE